MMWRYYIPDEHDNAVPPTEDMYVVPGKFVSAWGAAQAAVQDDWDNHDGWERGCNKPFDLVVVHPDGEHFTFVANNEATVSHTAEKKEPTR